MKKTLGSVAVADAARRYWPLWVASLAALLAGVLFAVIISDIIATIARHQRQADQRAEVYRRDICAILSTEPVHVQPQIARARADFTRAGHPNDCQPMPGVTPSPIPVRVYINGKPATIIVNPPESREPSREPSSGPSPRSTHSPSPHPTPRPTRSPHPTPSPSCILPPPLRCPPI